MLQWGVLGAGNISGAFVAGLAQAPSGRLAAVASRELAKAQGLAAQGDGEVRSYARYEDLLADSAIDAVYIGLPHTEHLRWTVAALRAGKHVLCEKPLALNHAEAMLAFTEAERAGKLLMEAFMYRCLPQTAKLVELLQQGIIGRVRHIQASFSFASTPRAGSRLWEPSLAGGGIMDVGCYPVSMARLVAGVAQGQPFAQPLSLQAQGRIGETGVDEWAVATLLFPGDIVAQIATGICVEQEESLRIGGSTGALVVPKPWYGAGSEGGQSEILLVRDEAVVERIVVDAPYGLYAHEIETFAAAVQQGVVAHPAMSAADSLGNLAVLDQWRRALGLVFPRETAVGLAGRNNLAGLPIARRADSVMQYGKVPGLDKPVSRLVMGVDNQESLPHAAAMFDDYLERGGNTFDTAWVYDFDGGHSEAVWGDWLRARGGRDDLVLISKGAHTPNCTPEAMQREFAESLERLSTDHADIYILHRDNLQVPVGEFVDVLNQHVRAGKFKVFGGSNWSLERVAEANAYAAKHGLQGFSVLSNQLSLARLLSPIWAGCVSAGDLDSRRWLTEQQLALFAWSSQARGFFTDRAAPDRLDDAELVRCWYSPENFQRRERAQQLARKKGVDPINVALAWVLAQPFPCFSLIGPRTLAETASSFRALEVTLSAEELAWLDLADQGASV